MQIGPIVILSHALIHDGVHGDAGRTMTEIRRTLEVDAPPEKVFAAISVPEKWPQWASFVREASSDGPKAHWIYEMGGGMKVESETEETEISQDRVYAFRQTGGFMKSGQNRMEIEAAGEGSRLTWTVQYEFPYSYLGKVMDKLKGRKQFEEAIDTSIRNLEELLGR